ncbi:MAG TPA: MATE family efflux transporter [Thermomicrobiales bacterium]|nr:MATE family efflux transporter [Thermomicrobiales bacterium]
MNVSPLRRIMRWFGIGIPADGTPDEQMRRRVVTMAWPAVIDGLLITAVQVVDTFLVSRVGDSAVAGVGTAIQLVFVMIVLLTAISVGCSVLVSQAVGARDSHRASALAKQSLVAGSILALPLTFFGLTFSGELVGLFGVEPAVAAIAEDYWRVLALSLVVFVNSFAIAGIMRGMGDTKTPMLGNLAANVVNAVVAYGLIFGELGFPEIGVVGSAWGTLVGRVVAVGLMLLVLVKRRSIVSLAGRAGWIPSLSALRDIGRIGIPSAVEQFSTSIAFATMTAVVAMLGTDALAAHRIAFNALTLSIMPAFGMAMAATALVGQATGAKDPLSGRRAARISATYAAVWMSLIGVFYFIVGPQIMSLFSSDPQVISQGGNALRVLALSQPFWAWMFVLSGAMRGIGNSRYPMILNSITLWIAVLIGLALIRGFDLGLGFVWSAFLFVSPVTIYLLQRRLFSDPLMNETDGAEVDTLLRSARKPDVEPAA